MKALIQHSVFAWLLIIAQTMVIVVGHGRVVVCYDDNGSTHIELVSEGSCGGDVDDGCDLVVNESSNALASVCSQMPCVDELYGQVVSLSNVCRADALAHVSWVPICEPTVLEWCALTQPAEIFACVYQDAVDFEQSEERRSMHATILVL